MYFRASTQAEARARGVRGHARNLPDGRVEVLACGEPAAVVALCDWLRSGPPQARVSGVECSEAVLDEPADFTTG